MLKKYTYQLFAGSLVKSQRSTQKCITFMITSLTCVEVKNSRAIESSAKKMYEGEKVSSNKDDYIDPGIKIVSMRGISPPVPASPGARCQTPCCKPSFSVISLCTYYICRVVCVDLNLFAHTLTRYTETHH